MPIGPYSMAGLAGALQTAFGGKVNEGPGTTSPIFLQGPLESSMGPLPFTERLATYSSGFGVSGRLGGTLVAPSPFFRQTGPSEFFSKGPGQAVTPNAPGSAAIVDAFQASLARGDLSASGLYGGGGSPEVGAMSTGLVQGLTPAVLIGGLALVLLVAIMRKR